VNISQPKLRSEKFDDDDDDDNNNNNNKRFKTETNDISTMNSNNRRAATLYALGT
jgi:hypothetical protein